MISFKVNGMEVQAQPEETILDAARRAGFKIPTLCHHESMQPYGACRLCVVEISQGKWNWIAASCTAPAKEGYEIQTHSEKVLRYRRLMLELLLARCPDSKDLRRLAEESGLEHTRFRPYRKEKDDCILCGLCVRICEAKMGRSAIGFAGRGWRRIVTPAFQRNSPVCMACGACAKVCPTHTIDKRLFSTVEPRPGLSQFNAGMCTKPAISTPFPQAVPNVPAIDPEQCVRLKTGACGMCAEVCQAKAIDFEQQDTTAKIPVGAVIVATGSEPFDPSGLGEYGYGRFPNVVSSIEYERLICASGPTEGHIARPSDHHEPRRIAFLQCVGSRDSRCGRDYCSSVCCAYATKEAILTREHCPDVKIAIFGMDFRTFGKDFERFMTRAKEQCGVRYVHCRVPAVEEDPETHNLWLQYETDGGHVAREEFDLVVLSVGLDSPEKARELASRLGLETDEFGFAVCPEDYPLRTARAGVFVCGAFEGPKDIPETVAQASGAAALAAGLLNPARGTLVARKEYPAERNVRDERPRVGVFVCSCGSNIGGVVRVREVVEAAAAFPDVVHAESFMYTCSADALGRIRERVRERNLNRVVVAACTPRTHEPLFQANNREAGLNACLFEMANIRDQCSWVHPDTPEEATRKSIALVRSAVMKVRLAEPLSALEMDIEKSGLVIGGGVAGMTAALALADQGFPVFLVEKEAELGGLARRIHKTLGGLDVAASLNELRRRVSEHPLITVFLNSRLVNLQGSVGAFMSAVKTPQGERALAHGVIIVATGGREHETSEFLYGRRPDVMTQMEFEARLAGGRDLEALNRVVMIQCVGSRCEEFPNCSRVCCAEAVKNAITLKERRPGAEVIVLYRDMRTYERMELAYRKAREMGVLFVRYDEETRPEVTGDGAGAPLRVRFHEPSTRQWMETAADAIVLSVGVRPAETNPEIGPMLKVPLTHDGFFFEAHVKLRPVDFATDGVFVCGLAHSPRLLHEAAAQGLAAASRAGQLLSRDKLETLTIVSTVNPELCSGCRMCATACSFAAITFDPERGVSVINPTLCKGCGTCVANCPSGAANQLGFRDDQIFEQIAAVTMP